nr:G protein-coupled receptor [Proales similis]
MPENCEKNMPDLDKMDSNRIVLFAIKFCIILVTSILNGTLILAFGSLVRGKKWQFTNSIFLSIALSDFSVGILTMTSQKILDTLEKWPFDERSCLISIYMQYAIPDTTILALLVLTVHRFLQIRSPFRLQERMSFANWIKLLAPWLLCASFWLVSICWMVHNSQVSYDECNIHPTFCFKQTKVLVFGLIPIVIIIFLNSWSIFSLSKTGRRLKKSFKKPIIVRKRRITQSEQIEANEDESINQPGVRELFSRATRAYTQRIRNAFSMSKEQRAVTCILALTLSILFTQIIYLATWPMLNAHTSESIMPVYRVGVWLSYLTSLTNPILIIMFHGGVRKKVKLFFEKTSSTES